jgi:hypothetical protein|tara:strand:+ start:3313 stop:3756 length:444 start_codon:yes stop_codon:yes gene_type:complete
MVARARPKRMYRTMQGRMVDIEKLRAANEDVRAVGNMGVNARGDVLGPSGSVTATKAEVMQKYYEQPKGMVDDTPARSKPSAPKKVAPAPQKTVQKMTPVESKPAPIKTVTPKKVEVQPKPVETFKPKTSSTPAEKKGIDAALDGLE